MKKVFYLYLLLTMIFSVNIWLSFNQISFRGYWSDKVLAWLWLLFTVFLLFRYWKLAAMKIYSGLIFITIGLSLLPMGLPFAGMLFFFTMIGDEQRIPLNDDFRLEKEVPAVLYAPSILIYKADGLLEKRVEWINYGLILEKLYGYTKYEGELEKYKLLSAELLAVTADSITINYEIEDSTGQFVHYLNETHEEHQKRYYSYD